MDFVLEEGEGQFIEFKERFDSKGLAREIVAFANSSGGKIFFGISDKGEVRGIDASNKLKSQIQDVARNCDPLIEIKIDKYEDILIVEVGEGMDKPYSCSSGFYLRQGTNSQKMSRDEIFEYARNVGKIKFEETLRKDFDYPADFDEKVFREMLRKMGISRAISDEMILNNLGLGEKVFGKMTLNNSGVLFFGKNIERFFKNANLTCVLFKGRERLNVIDRKDFVLGLVENYNEGINFLRKHLNLGYIIKGTGPRKEVLELPEAALREAVLNAIVHRDYFDSGMGVNIEIFDDRVEITNRGKLFFDKSELGKLSLSRNPVMFDIFNRLDMIEKIGSGINRIKEEMKEKGLLVDFEVADFFRVVFWRLEDVGKNVGKNVGKRLGVGKRRDLIIEEIRSGNFSLREFALVVGVDRKTIERDVLSLKDGGVIRRVGPVKGGHWEIINSEVGKK